MTDKRKNLFIFFVALLLVVTLAAEVLLIFNITTDQTRESGLTKVESLNSEFETKVGDASNETLSFAVEVQPHLYDMKELRKYIFSKKESMKKSTGGECVNVYIGSPDYYIIPGSVHDAKFSAEDTEWFKGALKLGGEAYVTQPYYDEGSKSFLITVSVLLSDGVTVVAQDYSLGSVQSRISEAASDSGNRNIIMVSRDGLIFSSSQEELIGERLIDVVPEYSGVYALVRTSGGSVNITQKRNNIFAVKSDHDWTLIVSERTFSLYRTSFVQIIGMSLVMLIIFGFIIVMSVRGIKTSEHIRVELEYRDRFLRRSINDLKDPLSKIITSSSEENIKNAANYEQEFNNIRSASYTLSEKMREIVAYSELIMAEKQQPQTRQRNAVELRHSRHFRGIVVFALCAVLSLSAYINVFAAYNYGKSSMEKDVAIYNSSLSEWIYTQKSILDMYCSIFSTDPGLLDDYDATVKLLGDITSQYPDISVTYLANPDLTPTAYVSNGWIPEDDVRIEEREWYVQTESSDEGWSISSPYYDVQTGNYCVTFSKVVYDTEGNFVGIFGIDFYMDKLIDILGGSYTDDSYAFLVDGSGRIINHPYGAYQMSRDSYVNVLQTNYSTASTVSSDVSFFRDYDDVYKAVIADDNGESQFSIYVVKNIWHVYRKVLIYSLISIIILVLCVILVYKLISSLIDLQEDTNVRLKQSADAAIAADEAKSSFLAQMSHEIRTPINAVIGMNEMILRESTDNNIREYAVNIQSAGRTLLSLINSILDFSKIEDGKMEIIPVKYDTASMIHDLVASVSPRAKSKGLELIVRTDATLPAALKGDDVRIKQVISNLLTNAVKYTEKGSVTFIIKRENQHDDSIDLYVEVTDTGIGIKEEDIGALFESFKRLDEKRNRNIEGTGLGMSIVTKLLEMMGSKLEVRSEYGKGSTFSFRVKQRIESPVAMGDYTARIMKQESLEDESRHIYASRAKVLIVDDNEMNIKVAVSMMKIYGIIPDTADSGFESIERVKEKEYHIIFMDHMMPRLDGVETLEKMKEENLLRGETAVIALTANAIVGAREMYLDAGFDDYLSKPIDSRKLEKLLEKYLPEEIVTHRKVFRPKSEEQEGGDTDMFSLRDIREMHEKCPQIDVMTGLGYCMESKEFYLDTLEGYLEADKTRELKAAFDKGDFETYGIHAHSLKSTSKTIGALVLSEHAKELEFAAKRGDKEYIRNHHEEVMKEYAEILDGVREVLKNEQGTGN